MKALLVLLFLALGAWSAIEAQLWEPLGGGVSARVEHISAESDVSERLYLCGSFKYAGGNRVDGIAVWDGVMFSAVGNGMPDGPNCPYDSVPTICQLPMSILSHQGEIFLSGGFNWIGGADSISKNARWDGSRWMDCHYPNHVLSLSKCNGDLFAFGLLQDGSSGRVQKFGRWNGIEFEQFGPELVFSQIGEMPYAIEVFQGTYYLGGNFDENGIGEEITHWDEAGWRPLGNGIHGNSAVLSLESFRGHLFVGGTFWMMDGNSSDFLTAWDGKSWFNPFPNVVFMSPVVDMKTIDGELYIVGHHLVQVEGTWLGPFGLARYDGANFRSIGGEFGHFEGIAGVAGELVVFGNMTSALGSNGEGLGDSIHFLGRWIGGDLVDAEVYQSLPDSLPRHNGMELSLFPNPVSSSFSLSGLLAGEAVDLLVQDLAGRLTSLGGTYRAGDPPVDVSMLPAGVYVLEVRPSTTSGTGRGQVEYIKLIKQ